MEEKNNNKKKNKKKQVATWVILIVAVICIIIGIFELKDSFIKFNHAVYYTDKILNLFTKSK